MSSHSLSPAIGLCKTAGTFALLLVLAACAQPQQSSDQYDTSRENTQHDAQNLAMGGSPRAASQLQLGFGETGTTTQAVSPAQAAAGAESPTPAAATAALPRPLAEARSFLGTVPCPSGMACEASRFVVTLAPGGEWRARTTLLVGDQPSQTILEQGCWDIIGDAPLRIALMHDKQDTAKADLSFLNGNTLRVHALNGVQPMLEHRLTRQADLDPIDELKDRPALSC